MDRILISADPSKLDTGRAATLRFRWRLPGEENESAADVELVSSIRKHGILDPPILYGEPPITVCGHRRIAAARAAGLEKIDAFVIEEPGTTREEIASLWLEDVRYGAEPSDLEKIMLTVKCRSFLGDTFASSLEALEAAVGKSLSDEYLDAAVKLLDLPEDILDSLHAGELSTGDLISLGAIDTKRAARILYGSGLGRKDKREAIRTMLRIHDSGAGTWESFAEDYEKNGGPLLEKLRAAAYPSLTGDLARIDEIVKSMGLQQGTSIQPPENLEGGSYRLDARICDTRSFDLLIEKFRNAIDEGKIERLLDIVKGRKEKGP
jgi:ParB-like chromosome segregation protein Spo0J